MLKHLNDVAIILHNWLTFLKDNWQAKARKAFSNQNFRFIDMKIIASS